MKVFLGGYGQKWYCTVSIETLKSAASYGGIYELG